MPGIAMLAGKSYFAQSAGGRPQALESKDRERADACYRALSGT